MAPGERIRRFLDPTGRPGTRLTVQGFRFIILAGLLSLAAVNTGNNFIYLILAMIVAMVVVSYFSVRNILKTVRVELGNQEPLFAGEPAQVEVGLSRTGKRPVYDLHVRLDRQSSKEGSRIPFLPAGRTVWQHTPVRPSRRGRLRFDRMLLSCGFPFGLIMRTEAVRVERTVLVYPRLLEPSEAIPDPAGSEDGTTRGRPGTGDEYNWTRNYRTGDPFAAIHWKATARLHRLMVKEYTAAQPVRISTWLFNTGPWKGPVFEKAVSLSASVCLRWMDRGYAVSLVTAGEALPFDRSPLHRTRILERLALIHPEDGYESAFGADTADFRIAILAPGQPTPPGLDFDQRIHAN